MDGQDMDVCEGIEDVGLTLRKYRSSKVELLFLVPAMKTRTIHIKTAMERRKGAVMQQIRPALTMMALCIEL
jgi:hypothetical protein